MEPNHYAELKETIPTTSPEWIRGDNAKRARQLEEYQEEIKQKARLRARFGLG